MHQMSRFAPFLMPCGSALLRVIPRAAALRLASAAGAVCCLVLRSRRATILANLSRTAPNATPAERHRLARSTFRHLAIVWVDLLRLPSLSHGEIRDLVNPESTDALRAVFTTALAEGRGAMVVSLHLGAMDVALAYLAANGWMVTTVGEDLEVGASAVWRRYRTSAGQRVVSQRLAAVSTFRALVRGEIVAVAADRVIAGSATEVDFCAGRRRLPTGPAAFALRAGAPLLLAYLIRHGTGYTAVCRRLTDVGTDPVQLTRAMAGAFSEVVHRHPDQWFVFQPDWLDASGPREHVT